MRCGNWAHSKNIRMCNCIRIVRLLFLCFFKPRPCLHLFCKEYNLLKDQLLAVSQKLQSEKQETEDLKLVISTLEEKVSKLESTEKDNLCLKNDVESLSAVNDELRDANILLKTKLEFAEASTTASNQAESRTADEIENLKNVH